MMHCRCCFLLLLTLFAATVISQDGDDQCLDAARALAANQLCANATEYLNDAIESNTTISMETLYGYCTPSCRALNRRLLSACANLTTDTTQLYCTVHEGVSCYDVVATFTDEILDAQIECAIESPTDSAQTCSPRCIMVVQNFINAGGCCYVETLAFVDQLASNGTSQSADSVRGILSACPDFNNRIENTCQVINGSMTGPGDQGEDNNQCLDATTALAANQPCFDAVGVISELGNSSNTTISMETLNAYCTPSCRALNNRVLSACVDLNVDGTQLYCTVHEGVSCYDVATTFTDGMQDGVLAAQIACAVENLTDPTQTCSPGCMMAVQNFINAGGCCFLESLEFADQFTGPNSTSADIIRTILSACPGDINQLENTCQVINGSMTGPGDQGEDNNQCINATIALAANQSCFDAVGVISELGNSSNTTISMETLNAYCTPSCRALNNRVSSACADLNVDTTQLYCTAYEGVSCYDVVTTFTDGMQDEILEAQIACAVTSPTDPAQTCSPGCMMAVQNFINAGGCCFLESLEIADQFTPNGTSTDSVRGILSACPGDINRIENTCQVIDGSMTGPGDQGEGMHSAGLVASGNILLIGAIIVVASLLVYN